MRVVMGIIVFLLLLSSVNAAVDPLSRTDAIIKQEHEKTREWCLNTCTQKFETLQEVFDSEKKALADEAEFIFWKDRVLSFGSLFAAMFFGITLKSYIDLQRKKRREIMDLQKPRYEDMLCERIINL